MRHSFIVAIAAASLVLSGCGTLPSVRSNETIAQPRYRLSDQDFSIAQALAHYSHALVKCEEFGRGTDPVIQHLVQAVQLDPCHYELTSRLAGMYLSRGKVAQATDVLQAYAARNTNSPQVWIDLAAINEVIGRLDNAAELFERATTLDPTNALLACRLARVHFARNADQRALDTLKNAITHSDNPRASTLYTYNCGLESVAAGNIPRAIQCFALIADTDPEYLPNLYFILAELHSAIDQEAEAERYLRRAIDRQPASPEAYIRLAEFYMRQQPEKAEETLKQASSLWPTNYHILTALGMSYNARELYPAALAVFEEVEKITTASPDGDDNPLPLGYYISYGAAQERTGNFSDAERIFQAGLVHYPDAHVALNYLAYMWADNNMRLDEALKLVTRAIELEPDNGAYVDTLGWIYFRKRQFKEALIQIERANELEKDDSTIADHLGDVFDALGRPDDAVAAWKRSLKIDPTNKKVADKLRARNSLGPDPVHPQEPAQD